MRLRDTLICLLCIAIAIASLTAASNKLDSIHAARKKLWLVSNEPLKNAPPSLAFATVAMGAFRGLVVDILWMRADKLKEEGQFFDAKQLAEWITVLQPRFAAVWDFQAWNMAYNISVAMPASQWQERWRWVKNGYELLRDKGIQINPHSVLLHRSLAWIFQHKIGGVSDDVHKHYKRELALAMRPLLGNQTNGDFKQLIDTPKTLSDITAVEGVNEFITALKATDEVFADDDKLIGSYLALRQSPKKFPEGSFDVIDRFRNSDALEKFDVFARAHELRNTWKLEPELMDKLNKTYGPISYDDPNSRLPLNWEHCQTHAMYWAEKGLQVAKERGKYEIQEKHTDRIIYHSLQSLYRAGKLIIYPVPDKEPSVFLRPDLRMFDSCNEIWLERIEKYERIEGGQSKGVQGGYRNMLINAVATFYQAGHVAKAGRIYNTLRERYPRDEFKVPLITFVRKRIAEEMRDISIHDARELILMSLHEAYFQYSVYEDDEAFAREKWAKETYNIYQKEFGQGDTEIEVQRLELPSFELLRYLAFMGFMNDPYYPENLRSSLFGRIKIERPDLYEKLRTQADVFIEKYQDTSP